MGANAEATNAVREAAFDEVVWYSQEAGTTAVNGVPTSSTDGVSLAGRSAFAFQVVDTNTDADLTITVWGYANSNWGKIPDGEYTVTAGGLLESTPVGGACERVYLEISAYTAGTVSLNVGVPQP